ncbi:hypothetical protein H4R33_003019 [Dimargaris cristalligena]|nr:hypothetical protein H4R33_003019 [Dimargaris cristalligena]
MTSTLKPRRSSINLWAQKLPDYKNLLFFVREFLVAAALQIIDSKMSLVTSENKRVRYEYKLRHLRHHITTRIINSKDTGSIAPADLPSTQPTPEPIGPPSIQPTSIPLFELAREDSASHAFFRVQGFLLASFAHRSLLAVAGDALSPELGSLYKSLLAETTTTNGTASVDQAADSFVILMNMFQWTGLTLIHGRHYTKFCQFINYINYWPQMIPVAASDRLTKQLLVESESWGSNTTVYLKYDCHNEGWSTRYAELTAETKAELKLGTSSVQILDSEEMSFTVDGSKLPRDDQITANLQTLFRSTGEALQKTERIENEEALRFYSRYL